MSTSVDLTDQELAELRAYTKETNDTAAIRSAMIEYLRLARRLQLKALSGQVEMEENWQTLEGAELKDRHGGSATGAH